jgi:hypothetical protein
MPTDYNAATNTAVKPFIVQVSGFSIYLMEIKISKTNLFEIEIILIEVIGVLLWHCFKQKHSDHFFQFSVRKLKGLKFKLLLSFKVRKGLSCWQPG